MNEIIHLKLEESDALLPCPFCGSEDLELANTWTAHYWIDCLCCGCHVQEIPLRDRDPSSISDHLASRKAVIELWNTRAAPSAEIARQDG